MPMLRLPEVKKYTGHRSDASIYNQVRDGLFTKPIRIGKRATAWPSHEVDAVIQARIAGDSEASIRRLVDRLHEQRKGLAQPTPEAKAPAVHLSLAGE